MSQRTDRIGRQLLQVLNELIRTVKDPEMSGLVTLTEVRVTPDLKTAFVFYSVYGSKLDREATGRALERAAGYLRKRLGQKLEMRRLPALKFDYDPTPERADRIDRIFHHLDKERPDADPTPPEDPADGSGEGPSPS